MNAEKLKHSCWIHDSDEDYGADSCDLCHWLCPECGAAMESDPIGKRQGEGSRLFKGVWRCPECETFINFASKGPALAMRREDSNG